MDIFPKVKTMCYENNSLFDFYYNDSLYSIYKKSPEKYLKML